MIQVRVIFLLALLAMVGCGDGIEPRATGLNSAGEAAVIRPDEPSGAEQGNAALDVSLQDARWAAARHRMVERQLRSRGIRDERVLQAMERVPRHRFVPSEFQATAYEDTPLPIGHEQTISQPYIVALMTELVRPQAGDRALDIGTGSGYQAAVLSGLVSHVYSIEIVEPLALESRQRLGDLGFANVEVRHGDGYQGWPQQAPFDVITVAAAADEIPQPLIDQLAVGGRMVIPVGEHQQQLLLIEKLPDGSTRQISVAPVAFVPMTGEAQGGN